MEYQQTFIFKKHKNARGMKFIRNAYVIHKSLAVAAFTNFIPSKYTHDRKV